jgi:hypothetical protein
MNRTIITLKATAIIFRGLANLIRLAPFVVLLWCYLSPVSPHFLIRGYYGYYYYGQCIYLGIRGFQTPKQNTGCPFLILINTDKGDVYIP